MSRPIVGVVGGGQLARMMIPAAIQLGIEIRVFAEGELSSARQAVTLIGDYTDLTQLRAFAAGVDVLTFDHEHVPLDVLRAIEAEGVKVSPSSHALAHTQNKLVMRRKLVELGVPVPRWAEARSASDVASFLAELGPEIIVKTPIGGYDGKGVRVVSEIVQIVDWLENLDAFGGALLLEEKVPFVRELALLSARNRSGEFRAWPVVQTTQQAGVCAEVIAPAPAPVAEQTAIDIASRISNGIGVEGVLAVEMFELADGRLLVNELAMRPHNSGHFSIEGSVTSQFEQHLRAVLDLPLGDSGARAPWAVMVNLLGVDSTNTLVEHHPAAMAEFPSAKLHNYEKSARAGRKMGHVTAVGADLAETLAVARQAAARITGR